MVSGDICGVILTCTNVINVRSLQVMGTNAPSDIWRSGPPAELEPFTMAYRRNGNLMNVNFRLSQEASCDIMIGNGPAGSTSKSKQRYPCANLKLTVLLA